MAGDTIREEMDDIDELIEKTLKEAGKPLSTYLLAKKTELSWSTINTHLYKLKGLGIVEGALKSEKIGTRKKRMWWLSKTARK